MMRNDRPPSVFHVGHIKTGSTWLQQRLFANEAGGVALAGGALSRAHLVDALILRNTYDYDPRATAARLLALEDEAHERGLRPVWSDETLLGNPFQRAYHGASVMRRIAELDIAPRIVVTIREQRALAMSAYGEYVGQGGRLGLTEFIGTGREAMSFTPILRQDYMTYDVTVGACMDLFGPQNVMVVPLEALRRDMEGWTAKLCAFLEVDPVPAPDARAVNAAQSPLALRARRVLNRFHVRSPLSQRRSLLERAERRALRLLHHASPRCLDARMRRESVERVRRRYEGVFGPGNRRLEEMIGLDLRTFGYQ